MKDAAQLAQDLDWLCEGFTVETGTLPVEFTVFKMSHERCRRLSPTARLVAKTVYGVWRGLTQHLARYGARSLGECKARGTVGRICTLGNAGTVDVDQ